MQTYCIIHMNIVHILEVAKLNDPESYISKIIFNSSRATRQMQPLHKCSHVWDTGQS